MTTAHSLERSAAAKALLPGIFGCILMAAGDWLMIFGDTAFDGVLPWLTRGIAQMAPWRNTLAMGLAFPAVILYSLALFHLARLLPDRRHRRHYRALTAVGMTPWLCLHLFYVMILSAFGWLNQNGAGTVAFGVCEALFHQFSWLIILAEVLMVLPFCYLFCLTAAGRSHLPRWMAINNPLFLYVLLKVLTGLLPDTPLRLALTNGLMSESMLVYFLLLILAAGRRR